MASRERSAAAGLGRVLTAKVVGEMAAELGVCVRPVLRRVTDRVTGTIEQVTLPCGSTRESMCASCATKARRLRMQQCAEGWHLEQDPFGDDQPESDADGDDEPQGEPDPDEGHRRVRSPRRRQDVVDLPRMPVEGRSIGRTFTAPDGTMTERVEDSNGVALTSWEEALDELDADPEAQPAVVMRFGSQVDIQGIIAPSRDADRAIRYLTRYLTKAVAETYTNPDHEAVDDGYEAHIERSAGRPSGCTTCGTRAPLCGWAPAPTPRWCSGFWGTPPRR